MNWGSLLAAAVMLGALAAMMKMNRKLRQNPGLRKWIFLCFAIVLFCGGYFLHSTGMLRSWGVDFGWNRRLLDADAAIYASQAAVIGELLKEHGLAQEKILILHDRAALENPDFRAFRAALEADGRNAESLLLEPVGGAGESNAAPGPSTMLTASMLDKAARKHPECKVVISTVGTPIFDSDRLSCISGRRSPRAPQWILLEPIADPAAIQRGLTGGNVLAAVRFLEVPAGETVGLPDSPREIFDLRYRLITP